MMPKKIYITSGVGFADPGQDLLAFDRALGAAGTADFNHLRVSSIVPPHAQLIFNPPPFPKGSLVYTVYSRMDGQAGDTITACLIFAEPEDPSCNGAIFEVSAKLDKVEVQDLALKMVTQAMNDREIPIRRVKVECRTAVVPANKVGSAVVTAVFEL